MFQPFANQTACEACPLDGSVACDVKDRIQVEPLWYLVVDSPEPNATNVNSRVMTLVAGLCPMGDACVGSSLNGSGTSSCAAGYQGPLCGVCSDGLYRSLRSCKACPSGEDAVSVTFAVAISMGGSVLVLVFAYLWLIRVLPG